MIFISYAHADNQTFTKEQKGWIELLHERLDIRVEQLTGKRQNISIWRDKNCRVTTTSATKLSLNLNAPGFWSRFSRPATSLRNGA
jgi:hypothetical protein